MALRCQRCGGVSDGFICSKCQDKALTNIEKKMEEYFKSGKYEEDMDKMFPRCKRCGKRSSGRYPDVCTCDWDKVVFR